MSVPFTAARARNAGFRRLRETAPELSCVQLIDGDCELIECWPNYAIRFLEAHPNVAAVSGRLRERYPERSVYNWLCDQEWNGIAGRGARLRRYSHDANGGARGGGWISR